MQSKNRVENTPRRKYKTLLSYSRLYLFQLPLLRNACHREPHDPKPEDGVPGVALTRFLERSTTHNRGKSSSTRGFLPRSSSGRSFTVISREGWRESSKAGGVLRNKTLCIGLSSPLRGEISSGRLVSRGIPILLVKEMGEWKMSGLFVSGRSPRKTGEREGHRFWYLEKDGRREMRSRRGNSFETNLHRVREKRSGKGKQVR